MLFSYSGDSLAIQDLTNPIAINMNIVMSPERSYICKFWNGSTSQWSTEGVETYERRTQDLVECHTNHLSIFVVVSIDRQVTVTMGTESTQDFTMTGTGVVSKATRPRISEQPTPTSTEISKCSYVFATFYSCRFILFVHLIG